MLEDRDYMRQPEFRDRRVSLTVALLIANAVVFLVECLLSPQPGDLTPANPFFYKYFALSVQGLQHFYVWQLLTYQFLSLIHI